MGYIKVKGIVIREVNTGEADKVVTIFSKNEGKISAYARGARRQRSSISAGTQLLCYSEFILYKGKTMNSVSSCDVIEPFYEIRNDIVRLTYAAHILDIINDVVQEEQPAVRTLQLFLNTLHMLSKTDKSPELLVRIFELRLLTILGYAPYVRGCMVCGKEEIEKAHFSFRKCGFICQQCIAEDRSAMLLSQGTIRAIIHIIYSDIKDLFSFTVSKEVLSELSRVCSRYLRERLERDYTRLDFLKNLKL